MLTYLACTKEISRARNKEKGKKLSHNTYLRKEENKFIIKYHTTDIITIEPDDIYTFFTGGWTTYTTKKRFLDFTPLSVYQHNWNWYVAPNGDWKERINFFEGIKCDHTGNILNIPKNTKEVLKKERKRKQLDKMVKTFVKGFIEDIETNGIGKPDKGDCFGCSMVDASKGIKPGCFLENEPMGFDHYISHFKENYYPRSLLFKALTEKGYRNPLFIWQTGDADTFKRCLTWFFNQRKTELLKHF